MRLATSAAQITVVARPSKMEPPKASSSSLTGTPASRPSSHSIAGTKQAVPAIAASTKPAHSCRLKLAAGRFPRRDV
ncbi:MAG: hypothetical protein WBW76_04000, partial [Candidatus Cybelea sp.]